MIPRPGPFRYPARRGRPRPAAGGVSRHRYNPRMAMTPPFNLYRWIEQNRAQLMPPVGNKLLFQDSGFIVMAVGGPNSRKDFYHYPTEELLFQVEGDMVLKTVQDGR